MAERNARRIGVSFLPETEAIVRRVDREMPMHNFSGALRFIVHDWAKRVGPRPLPASPASGGGAGEDGRGLSITMLTDREG